MLLPFSLLGGWPLAAQVGDGVGTNLADINFQDAQAGRKLLVKPAELWRWFCPVNKKSVSKTRHPKHNP